MACEQEAAALALAWQRRLTAEADLEFIYNALLAVQTARDQADQDYEQARIAKAAADEAYLAAFTRQQKAHGRFEFAYEQYPRWQRARNDAIDAHQTALAAYNTCMANPPPAPAPNEV